MYSNICDKYIHRPAIFLLLLLLLLLDRREPGPIRSVLLIIIGWLFGSLVTQFSQLAQLGIYKGRKVTQPDFWKKFLIWRYWRKRLQISPKSDTLTFFSKTALTIFLVFGLKLVLNLTFNLNETYFSEKIAIWRYLTSKSSRFGCFLTIRRSSRCILVADIDLNKVYITHHCEIQLFLSVTNVTNISNVMFLSSFGRKGSNL